MLRQVSTLWIHGTTIGKRGTGEDSVCGAKYKAGWWRGGWGSVRGILELGYCRLLSSFCWVVNCLNECLKDNAPFQNLALCGNGIDYDGAASIAEAIDAPPLPNNSRSWSDVFSFKAEAINNFCEGRLFSFFLDLNLQGTSSVRQASNFKNWITQMIG